MAEKRACDCCLDIHDRGKDLCFTCQCLFDGAFRRGAEAQREATAVNFEPMGITSNDGPEIASMVRAMSLVTPEDTND